MSNVRFVPDLFLGTVELNKFRDSLDINGFRNILKSSLEMFGLIKYERDEEFLNGRVEKDTNNSLGQRTIKIAPIFAIDADYNFIFGSQINNLPITADEQWYWLKIRHRFVTEEQGIVSIDTNGALSGVGTNFLSTLRGTPDFPTRIRLVNSASNIQEYDVLEVVDDENAILSHPTTVSSSTPALFVPETGLNYALVGTFTPGIAIPNDNKYPFQYDDCQYELLVETIANTPPSFIEGKEFYLARIRVIGGELEIQDKRTAILTDKGVYKSSIVPIPNNPLIGVESVRWDNTNTPQDMNIVDVAWGLRSTNWVIDTSQNICTFLGGSLGGKYKTTADFTNGDCDGWRLYSSNGKYAKVYSSIKQGGAINLYLDSLNIDNFSNDGGVSFIEQQLILVPDVDEVIINFKANPQDQVSNVDRSFVFPVSVGVAECKVVVYKDPTCLYHLSYAYKNNGVTTAKVPFGNDAVGYYTEISFTESGTLLPVADRVLYPYNSDPSLGYIQLTMSPSSYIKTNEKIYKGDLLDVNTITSLSNLQLIQLTVGVSKYYQYFTGNVVVNDNLIISLDRTNAKASNKFTIHFNCQLALNNYSIIIIDDYGGANNILKEIKQADIYSMYNQDNGIVFECTFTDQQRWICSQNYATGIPNQVIQIDGDPNVLFNANGWGQVKGLFGYVLMDGRNNVANMSDRFIKGASTLSAPGTSGGNNSVTLSERHIPPHNHPLTGRFRDANNTGGASQALYIDPVQGNGPNSISGVNWGGDFITGTAGPKEAKPFDNQPQYYVVLFAKKMF